MVPYKELYVVAGYRPCCAGDLTDREVLAGWFDDYDEAVEHARAIASFYPQYLYLCVEGISVDSDSYEHFARFERSLMGTITIEDEDSFRDSANRF